MKSDNQLVQEILEIEKIIAEKKAVLDKRQEERNHREVARKFFDDNFSLMTMSDDNNIYPQDYYTNILNRFCNESFNYKDIVESYPLILKLRENYIEDIKSDIEWLKSQLYIIIKQNNKLVGAKK